MIIETIPVGLLVTNCYVIGCRRTLEAMILDPGGDGEVITALRRHNLKPTKLVNTHGHADHIAGNVKIRQEFPELSILIHSEDAALLTSPAKNLSLLFGINCVSPPADVLLAEGDEVTVGELRFRVLHLPGHTPGGIGLFSETGSEGRPVLFSGDALFAEGIGRTDLPGSNHAALIQALQRKVLTLPDECVVYPGHGPATTIGHERRNNPFLA